MDPTLIIEEILNLQLEISDNENIFFLVQAHTTLHFPLTSWRSTDPVVTNTVLRKLPDFLIFIWGVNHGSGYLLLKNLGF